MPEEPASLILELRRQMRAELGDVWSDMATKADLASVRSDVAEIKSDMRTLRADIASDILTTRKELSGQITGLRETIIDDHEMALRVCPSLLRFRASTAVQQYDGVGS
jgi:hypothetical protein